MSTLDAWLTILAAALNLTPQPDPLTQLVTHLDGRRALLVLNNMEAALESADGDAVRDALTHLRDATTSPRFLITSRSVPNVGEKRVHLGTMSVEESVSLFLMRAGLAGYRLRPEDEGLVWEIINLLDNYPLAIVLAALEKLIAFRVQQKEPEALASVESVSMETQSLLLLGLYAVAGDGVEATLTLRDASPVTLLLEDHLYGLPEIEGMEDPPAPGVDDALANVHKRRHRRPADCNHSVTGIQPCQPAREWRAKIMKQQPR